MKVKKFLKIFIVIILLLNIGTVSFAYDEDPDEWDYVWLDEAVEESKNATEPTILSRHAVVYERSSSEITSSSV